MSNTLTADQLRGAGVNPASIAVFKSKASALVEALDLPAEIVIGLALGLASAHGHVADIGRDALHNMLDQALDQTDLHGVKVGHA